MRFVFLLLHFLALTSTLLVATNPDLTFPLLPELFLVGSLAILVVYALPSLDRNQHVLPFREWLLIVSLILNALLLIVPRMLAHLLSSPGQQWIPCLQAGSKFYALECFVQSAMGGHIGVRTAYMLMTAIFVGLATFFLVRYVQDFWKYLLVALLAPAVLVCGFGLWGIATGTVIAMPDWILVPLSGHSKLHTVFTNVGWLWPYLLPSLIIALWGSFHAHRRWLRFGSLGLFALIASTCLLTLQRGGLLLVATVSAIGAVSLVFGRVQLTRQRQCVGIVAAALFIFGLLWVFRSELDQLLRIVLQTDKSMISSSSERLAMWQSAWLLFRDSPWLGHGYASWFLTSLLHHARAPEVQLLDTAHNFYVQLFVELGVFHSLLILTILVVMAGFMLKPSSVVSGRPLLGTLLIAGALVCTLVQELDYIRPTFYAFATLVGCVLGWPSTQNTRTLFWSPEGLAQRLIRLTAWSLLLISVSGIAFVKLFFSSHMYAFEARVQENSGQLERWGHTSPVVPAFANATNKYYSLFRVRSWDFPQEVRLQESALTIHADANTAFILPLRNGSRYLPRYHHITSLSRPYLTKVQGLRYIYPPLQANTAIVLAEGMHHWETFGDVAGRWCTKMCRFVARTCGRGLHVRVGPGVVDWASQSVVWKAWKIGRNIDQSSLVKRSTEPSEQGGEIRFNSAEAMDVVMPSTDDSFFLLEITATQAFIPSEQNPANADSRVLAVQLLDGACQSD